MENYTLIVCNSMYETIHSVTVSVSKDLKPKDLIIVLLNEVKKIRFEYPIHNLIYETEDDYITISDLLNEWRKITGSEWMD